MRPKQGNQIPKDLDRAFFDKIFESESEDGPEFINPEDFKNKYEIWQQERDMEF